MRFDSKFGITMLIGIVGIVVFIPPIGWYNPILHVYYDGTIPREISAELIFISVQDLTDNKIYSDVKLKFVKITDKDLDQIRWLQSMIHEQNLYLSISSQELEYYENWIREKYQLQFKEELENSHNVYFEYGNVKYNLRISD